MQQQARQRQQQAAQSWGGNAVQPTTQQTNTYQPGGAPGFGTSTNPETAGFNLFGDARNWLARNPQLWDQYGGQMSAGQSPWTQQAAGGATSAMGYTPQQVSGGSFTSGDWGAYMNPYTQNVIDTTMQDIDRSRQIANQQGARSAGASTYGGDRNALIEAETNRGYGDIAARSLAQLRSQGFNEAAGLMSQDLNRSYGASLANQGAGLQGAGLNLQGAGMLGGFGMQDYAMNQDALDRQYQEYMRSTYGPMQGYNFLSGMLNGQPPGGQTTGAGVAGGALSGASIGTGTGGPGLGTLVGGLIGAGIGYFGSRR
jgi:hypothetical protein